MAQNIFRINLCICFTVLLGVCLQSLDISNLSLALNQVASPVVSKINNIFLTGDGVLTNYVALLDEAGQVFFALGENPSASEYIPVMVVNDFKIVKLVPRDRFLWALTSEGELLSVTISLDKDPLNKNQWKTTFTLDKKIKILGLNELSLIDIKFVAQEDIYVLAKALGSQEIQIFRLKLSFDGSYQATFVAKAEASSVIDICKNNAFFIDSAGLLKKIDLVLSETKIVLGPIAWPVTKIIVGRAANHEYIGLLTQEGALFMAEDPASLDDFYKVEAFVFRDAVMGSDARFLGVVTLEGKIFFGRVIDVFLAVKELNVRLNGRFGVVDNFPKFIKDQSSNMPTIKERMILPNLKKNGEVSFEKMVNDAENFDRLFRLTAEVTKMETWLDPNQQQPVPNFVVLANNNFEKVSNFSLFLNRVLSLTQKEPSEFVFEAKHLSSDLKLFISRVAGSLFYENIFEVFNYKGLSYETLVKVMNATHISTFELEVISSGLDKRLVLQRYQTYNAKLLTELTRLMTLLLNTIKSLDNWILIASK